MIEEVPVIQRASFTRPRKEQVEAIAGTPTGFIVDAMGGGGALDYRLRPAIPEQFAFCGVALTCDAGPAVTAPRTSRCRRWNSCSAWQHWCRVRACI